jgi:hypothetical protein
MLPLRDAVLLPDNYAQYSQNTWLYKGTIRGFRISEAIYTLTRPHTSKQVYRIPLTDTDVPDFSNQGSLWLEFPDEYITGIRNPTVGDQYKRYYFFPSDKYVQDAGGWPTVPFYAPLTHLETIGANPAISASDYVYTLGVPVPAVAPGVTAPAVPSGIVAEYRTYLYTWVTGFGEEGPPSPPTVAGGDPNGTWIITMTPPTATDVLNRNLTNLRIYRTVIDSSGNATYYQVVELPIGTTSYSDSNLDTSIVNNYVMPSVLYTGPPAGLQGVVSMANGILAGWTNEREIWFSAAYNPHAWPATYALTVDYPVVGMVAIGSTLNIMTEGQPFIASGTTPDTMTIGRVTANEPCVSRGSIFGAGEGAYYASPNGLILLNATGTVNTTLFSIEREFWNSRSPATWAAGKQAMSYFAFQKGFQYTDEDPDNGLVLDHIEKNVPCSMIRTSHCPVINVYNDELSGFIFYLSEGGVRLINPTSGGSLLAWQWRSKKFRFQYPLQLKAFKIRFLVPPEVTITPPSNATRNNDQDQEYDQTKQWLIARVYADGRQIVVREVVRDSEVLLIPDGFKSELWEFQFEGQVNMFLFKAASSVKQLKAA